MFILATMCLVPSAMSLAVAAAAWCAAPFWCNAVKLRSSCSTLASALSARDCVSRIRARSSFWRSRHLQCGQWSVFEMCVSLAASTAAAAFVDSAGWVSTEGAGERVWVSSTAASVCASQKRPDFSSGRQGTRAVWEVGVTAGRGGRRGATADIPSSSGPSVRAMILNVDLRDDEMGKREEEDKADGRKIRSNAQTSRKVFGPPRR